MFRSATIIKELVLQLARVMFMLKHSVKLRRYMLCGDVAACRHIMHGETIKTTNAEVSCYLLMSILWLLSLSNVHTFLLPPVS